MERALHGCAITGVRQPDQDGSGLIVIGVGSAVQANAEAAVVVNRVAANGVAGAGGLPALGEQAASARIRYGMPDVLGEEQSRYANRCVMVVGSGASALGTLESIWLNAPCVANSCDRISCGSG